MLLDSVVRSCRSGGRRCGAKGCLRRWDARDQPPVMVMGSDATVPSSCCPDDCGS